MSLLHFYRIPSLSPAKKNLLINTLRQKVSPHILNIEGEYCFNIEVTAELTSEEQYSLYWLFAETFEPENFGKEPFLKNDVFEVGPRLNFQTAWSTNAVSICHAIGLKKVKRIERSRRYKIVYHQEGTENLSEMVLSTLYDKMTEYPYPEGIISFKHGLKPEPVFSLPLIEEGKSCLERINREMGLGFDKWDIDYYYNLFVHELKRNPTNVECFDLSQSNSEHSRHWFFKGRLIIDGKKAEHTLMEIIRAPYLANPNNSVIAFRDNSSSIKGFEIKTIMPEDSNKASRFVERNVKYNITFTAETHNFPSGVAPFPGAETGTGGRIRDNQAVGRGGLPIAGTTGYCVGNLLIPGYELPWEDEGFTYPSNLAPPLQIEIEASNGASDYGNKFGEPVIQGFTRSFGITLPDGERREWIKPIMFTGGIGQMDERHTEKIAPEKGMLIVKVGGPAYRIGVGGGAASSMIQGENIEELDFNAVQRGDAEMEQKLNRVIRACIEMEEENPIISIHDQGAGGNSNVLKELVYPEGGRIELRKIQVGDETLSVLEIWSAEYQENNALLIRHEKAELFESLCKREKVHCAFIGEITGDGFMILYDSSDGSTPVALELKKVLGEMPQKTFHLEHIPKRIKPLELPKEITVQSALERVLRLLSVGSKRFLVNKVDRSVTGLIAQQQCCGPLQLTVSDVAVIAQSHFGLTGSAIAIGEQPIKGLINPSAMARMSVAEALTNIVWAKITALEDIRCSANWMWAPKLPGEGALLYDAVTAISEIMLKLGIAVDGGKDSLSMAAVIPQTEEVVKSPGGLVISAYAPMPDITKVITPDIKSYESKLLWVDLGMGKKRLGGSSLAHAYGQIGDDTPDIEDAGLLKRAFNAIQSLIENNLILSGHDISDGGLITTVLEMAFAGNRGIEVSISSLSDPISTLFSEEAGMVMEYLPQEEQRLFDVLKKADVPFKVIGNITHLKRMKVAVNNEVVLNEDMPVLRALWEETSYQLDRLQANPECVDEEKKTIYDREGPRYVLSFTPEDTPSISQRLPVAIIREEGSNGDREMTSAFYSVGFEPWDITMTDLLEERITLSKMRGVVFVGGFSYADVLDSGKGWAGVIRFNKRLREEFQRFYERPNTFSLGVCNGCQLMALLGWVPWKGLDGKSQLRFIQNTSGRFESRFSGVRIFPSPSIMLDGMEGCILGIWVAHGEGRVYFPDKKVYQRVMEMSLSPIRYVDDDGNPTEKYPFNPNGSAGGITAICSPDGRHLAMMPHPERAFLKWQWQWMPFEWKKGLKASPWLRLFQNARRWCEKMS